MNAPANIKRGPALRIDESDHERALAAAISIHCPNQSDFAMACRVDIATMRDQAAAGMFRAGPSAAALLGVVARVGSSAAYAPASDRDLVMTRSALRQTIDAARALERARVDG